MHRYCRLFLPSFSQFFQPFEVAQTLKKSGRPHELRQGRARRTDGHFCPFTAVFLACFPVLCRYGQARAKIIPQAKRNARKKFFQNCAYFGLASTAGLCGVVTVPCGLSKKFRVIASRCFGCFCFGFVRFFFRFFGCFCFALFASLWLGRLAWCLAFTSWPAGRGARSASPDWCRSIPRSFPWPCRLSSAARIGCGLPRSECGPPPCVGRGGRPRHFLRL